MADTQEHDVHISGSLADIRAAAERLKSDEGERQRLQQDPVAYLAGMGVQLQGATADAVRQRVGQAAPTVQASVVHFDV